MAKRSPSSRPAIATALAMIMAATFLTIAAPVPAAARHVRLPAGPCTAAVSRAEREARVPTHLLTAISLAESGRWDAHQQAIIAWPWTVNAQGRGRYFDSKAAAVAAVERLRAQGVTNIDIGCMQVNLRYHPNAFQNLEEAFDPAHNATYAARFLKDLRDQRRSWSWAVGLYHSAQRRFNRPYRLKVYDLWYRTRRAAADAHRLALVRAYRARSAASRAGHRPKGSVPPSS